MAITGRLHDIGDARFRKVYRLNCDDFQFGIDFLFEHAFDGHQGAGERTRATAAGALVTDAQGVIVQTKNFEITAVAHQRRSDFLIQNLVDLQQPRIVTRNCRD